MPVLSAEGHPLYMVHRSMIDKFIVKTVMSKDGAARVPDLTLAELLGDAEMKSIFENTSLL